MAIQISKAVTDATVRTAGMNILGIKDNENFVQFSNQSFGMIVADDNGVERLLEVRFIAGAVDEDMTAQEKLDAKVAEWQEKLDKQEQKKKDRAEKAAKDKAERERKKAEREAAKKAKEEEGE